MYFQKDFPLRSQKFSKILDIFEYNKFSELKAILNKAFLENLVQFCWKKITGFFLPAALKR